MGTPHSVLSVAQRIMENGTRWQILLSTFFFNFHGSVHRKNILIYISNKTQRYTVYFIWKLLYVFRLVHHPSSGAQTTVSTASGICHTVTATCRDCSFIIIIIIIIIIIQLLKSSTEKLSLRLKIPDFWDVALYRWMNSSRRCYGYSALTH